MNIAVHPDSFLNTASPHQASRQDIMPMEARPVALHEELRWEDDGGALPRASEHRAKSSSTAVRPAKRQIAGLAASPVAGADDDAGRQGGKLTWLQYAGKRAFQEKIRPDHALAKFAILLGRHNNTGKPTGKAA